MIIYSAHRAKEQAKENRVKIQKNKEEEVEVLLEDQYIGLVLTEILISISNSVEEGRFSIIFEIGRVNLSVNNVNRVYKALQGLGYSIGPSCSSQSCNETFTIKWS